MLKPIVNYFRWNMILAIALGVVVTLLLTLVADLDQQSNTDKNRAGTVTIVPPPQTSQADTQWLLIMFAIVICICLLILAISGAYYIIRKGDALMPQKTILYEHPPPKQIENDSHHAPTSPNHLADPEYVSHNGSETYAHHPNLRKQSGGTHPKHRANYLGQRKRQDRSQFNGSHDHQTGYAEPLL